MPGRMEPSSVNRFADQHTLQLSARRVTATRNRPTERGQELVELGILVVLFILLVGGVMQFGHAFMVANMITHAARDGARLSASWAGRGACQQLTNTQPI